MYVLLVALMLCVYFYTNKIRNSKIGSKFWQYPTCYSEVPILGNLYKFGDGPKYFFKILFKICKRTCELGGVSRINGFNRHYLDIADVGEILKFYLDKDYLYKLLQVLSGDGSVFNLDASEAKVRRQLLLPAFSSRMLANYAEDICDESTWLIEELAQHAGSGPFRGDNYFTTFCLRCNLRIGKVLDIEKEVKLTEIVEKYRANFTLFAKRLFSVWRHSDFLYRYTSDFRRMKKYKLEVHRYADRVQDNRKQQLDSQETRGYGIFDGIIKNLSRREISEEIIVVSGTSEEPGLTIGYVLTLLSQYPSVQNKVYEELIEIFGDSDRPPVREDLLKMRYLNMVIKETLRLFPPAPLIFRKAHEEMTLSSGRVAPAGVGIAVPIIYIQRDPQYWGPDAKHFDPERFLPERLRGVPSDAFMPFSHGSRNCPGNKLAIYMVKAAVSSILRRYKIIGKPAPGPVPNIETKYELVYKPVNRFEIEIIKRI